MLYLLLMVVPAKSNRALPILFTQTTTHPSFKHMFFLFHVLAGIIIGLLLTDFLHDSRWTIPCIVGAALPDLIDKPLGYILFPQSIGYGRFLFHNFLLLIVLMVAGVILWKYRKTPVILALATGILSHQILDSMWREPVNWFWPLLGPLKITGASTPDYLILLVKQDLYNPSEWLIAIACIVGVLLFLCRDRLFGGSGRTGKPPGSCSPLSNSSSSASAGS